MATNVGYARCSADRQDLTAQRQQLAALGVSADRVYLDKGLTRPSRARLDQVLAAVREGDTFTVAKLDRLARSVPDALDILGQLFKRGIRFALGTAVCDWQDPFAWMFLQILAVVAEFEANLIKQRTREGHGGRTVARQAAETQTRAGARSAPDAGQRRVLHRRDRRAVSRLPPDGLPGPATVSAWGWHCEHGVGQGSHGTAGKRAVIAARPAPASASLIVAWMLRTAPAWNGA